MSAAQFGKVKARTGHRPAAAPARARSAVPPATAVSGNWRAAIEATVAGLHYELVEIERAPRGLLRVFIDRLPGQVYPTGPSEFVTVEDCEQVTRQLQYALEVDGVDYARLEVSSPGLDRPLRNEADFERFAGQEIAVVLKAPLAGRKNYRGLLQRAGDGWALVFAEGKAEQELKFQITELREARLVPVVDFKGKIKANKGPAADDGSAAQELGGKVR